MTDEDRGDEPEGWTALAARLRLGEWQGLAAGLAIVLAFLAGLYAIPLWVAALSGLAVFAAAVLARPGRRERRLAQARPQRRASVWPDSGMKVIAEGLADPCIITDAEGMVRYANAEAGRRFGVMVPGDPLSFKLRVTALHDALERVVALGAAERVGWSEKIPTERWFEARLSPIRFPPDPRRGLRRPDFVLVVVEDLTEQRRAERMRADFVANASHELRTPLASLAGFIETLQGPARNDPTARDRFLAIMGQQAARMKRLIDDLLSLSRIEMKAHVRPEAIVDLAEIVGHVVETLRPLAGDNGVEIAFAAEPAAMPLRGDRDELVQVFSNLIENAIKYGASGGRVEVAAAAEAGPKAGVFAVQVVDHGPGIAPEHLPRLTERFYRADIVSSREKQGTGLGLAIVKHILARHRGRLDIRSRPGEGATFTVRLDREVLDG